MLLLLATLSELLKCCECRFPNFKMADVLLINPKQYKKESKIDLILPPINLLRLASTLIEDGFSVKIIDFRVEKGYYELKKQLKKRPVCVGITIVTGTQIKYGLEVSMYVKSFGVPIVWGGKHPTADPYPTIKNRYIDSIVKGEGEYTFLKLVESLERKEDLSKIRGIIFKKNNKIIETPDAPLPNLERLPDIPYQLIDINRYKQKYTLTNYEGKLLLPFEASRGCPFRCSFCKSNIEPIGWRGISAEKTVNDLKNIINKFRLKEFMFVDENFFASHKRNKEFIYQLKKEKVDIKFNSTATISYLSDLDIVFLKQLKKVGMLNQTLSVESGSQRILNMINKPVNVNQVPKVAGKLKKAGINTNYALMIGFPYETIGDIKKTFLFAIKLLLQEKNTYVSIMKLAPMPGTQILEDCIKRGFKRPEKLEDWINISTFWDSPSSWIDNDVQFFMKKYKYMFALGASHYMNIPFRDYLIGLFGRLLRYRLKKNYYKFNIEEKLYNLSKKFINNEKLIEV